MKYQYSHDAKKMPTKQLIEKIDETAEEINIISQKYIEEMDRLISSILKILRFIDSSIIIDMYYDYRDPVKGGTFKPRLGYYKELGLLIYIENLDSIIEEPIDDDVIEKVQFSGMATSQLVRLRQGFEIYLTRSGNIIKFDRAGEWVDPESNDPFGFHNKLLNPIQLTVQQLTEQYDFVKIYDQFILNLKKGIINAVKANENKRPILKKIIEYLQSNPNPLENGE